MRFGCRRSGGRAAESPRRLSVTGDVGAGLLGGKETDALSDVVVDDRIDLGALGVLVAGTGIRHDIVMAVGHVEHRDDSDADLLISVLAVGPGTCVPSSASARARTTVICPCGLEVLQRRPNGFVPQGASTDRASV